MKKKSRIKKYIAYALSLTLIISGFSFYAEKYSVRAGEKITIEKIDENGTTIYTSGSGNDGDTGNPGNTGNFGGTVVPGNTTATNGVTVIYNSGSTTEGQCYFGTNSRALFECTVDNTGRRLILHRYVGTSETAVVYGKALINGSAYGVFIQKKSAIYRNQRLYRSFSIDEAFCRYMKLKSLSFVAVDGQKVSLLAPKSGRTEMVYAAKGLFYGGVDDNDTDRKRCHALEKLDLRGLDLSASLDLSELFKECSSLEYLELEGVVMNPTNMYWMFNGCGLKNVDLRWINTKNVTSMFGLFEGSGLSYIEFGPNFNTSNVTDMRRMFNICSRITHLDLSGFDTSKVTDMSQMFYCCYGLKDIVFGNGFVTDNVRDMSYMFTGCKRLEKIDISGFNVSQVQNMGYMFRNCENLKSLDLSKWNTSSATNMEYMFAGCSRMISLDISSFNTSRVINFYCMFKDYGKNRNGETDNPNQSTLDVSSFDLSRISGDIVNGEYSTAMFSTSLDFIIAPKVIKTLDSGTYALGSPRYRLTDFYRTGGSAKNLSNLSGNPIDANKHGLNYWKDAKGNITEDSLGLKSQDVLISDSLTEKSEYNKSIPTAGRYGTAVIEYKANGGINDVSNPNYFINKAERFYTDKNASSQITAFFPGSRSAMKLRYDSYVDYCLEKRKSFTYDLDGTQVAYTKTDADFDRWYNNVYLYEWYSKYSMQNGLSESFDCWKVNVYPTWYTTADTEYVNATTLTIKPAERTGYVFAGWYTDKSLNPASRLPGDNINGYRLYCGNVRAVPEVTGFTDRFILYAGWVQDTNNQEYRITYSLKGGAATDNPLRFTKNTPSFTLNTPVKAGYIFAGWTGSGLNGASMSVTVNQGTMGNLSFEALWTPDPNGFTYVDGPLELAYVEEEKLPNENEIVSEGIYSDLSASDESLVKASQAVLFANGGKIKSKNINCRTAKYYINDYPSDADNEVTTALNGRSTTKTFKGKIVTAVTSTEKLPTVKNGKAVKSDTASKVASATYKKADNSINVTAKSMPGEVYVWALLLEKKSAKSDYVIKKASYVKIQVKLAPTKVNFGDSLSSDIPLKKSEGFVGDSEIIYIVPTAKTGEVSGLCTYIVTLSGGGENYISIEPVEGYSRAYKITAKAVKNGKKTTVKVTAVCEQNNKKAVFSYTVKPR